MRGLVSCFGSPLRLLCDKWAFVCCFVPNLDGSFGAVLTYSCMLLCLELMELSMPWCERCKGHGGFWEHPGQSVTSIKLTTMLG